MYEAHNLQNATDLALHAQDDAANTCSQHSRMLGTTSPTKRQVKVNREYLWLFNSPLNTYELPWMDNEV